MYQDTYDFKQREVHISLTQGFNPTGWDGEKWVSGPNDIKDWNGGTNTLHSIYLTKNANVTGLEPEITYYVRVVDVDKTGQRSEPSDEIQVMPAKYSGGDVTEIVWNSLHPTLQLVQVTNRDPFIIPENDGSYGLQLLSETKEYKFFPSDDAHVDEFRPSETSNYGTRNKMNIRNLPVAYLNGQQISGTSHNKAYIRFDFDQSSIPAEEEITDVRLVFYAEGSKRSVILHEVLSAWQELTITGRNQPNVAASEMIPAFNIASAGFIELVDPAITAWVNAVKAGTKTNYGFRLWSTAVEDGKILYIRSGEYADPIYYPYLYVKTSTGITAGLNIMVTPGTMFVRNQVVRLNDATTIALAPNSTNYVFADIDDNGLFINSVTSQLLIPAGSLMIGVVTTDSTGVVGPPDITRKSGRREGNISFESMGVYKENSGGARAGNVYIGDWQQISSGGTASWEHNFNSLDVEVIGHFATSENPSSFQNIVPAIRINDDSYKGITVAVTNNTVVFKAPPAGTYNFVHYDAITHTSLASGYVRAIVKLLK